MIQFVRTPPEIVPESPLEIFVGLRVQMHLNILLLQLVVLLATLCRLLSLGLPILFCRLGLTRLPQLAHAVLVGVARRVLRPHF
jgi:hypothetical protein